MSFIGKVLGIIIVAFFLSLIITWLINTFSFNPYSKINPNVSLPNFPKINVSPITIPVSIETPTSVEISTPEKVSIGEIVKNPNKYLGKMVEIKGAIDPNYYVLHDQSIFTLTDDQGYIIHLDYNTCHESERTYQPGHYEAKGTIYETCICQSRHIINITKEEWDKIRSHYTFLPENDIFIDSYGTLGSLNDQPPGGEIGQPYLILPSPENGWYSGTFSWDIKEVNISECNKTFLYAKNYTIKANEYYSDYYYHSISIQFNSGIIEERRCKPNSIKVYLQCMEPMIKVS
jgi:hypothetical protein